MECICIENKYNNTIFTLNKCYEVDSEIGVRSNWSNIWCHFVDYNRPSKLEMNTIFEFGMCKFKIIKI